MKRKLVLCLVCCCVILGVVGCGKEEVKDDTSNNNQTEEVKDSTSEKSEKEIYLDVIANKRNYISEDNTEKNVEDYLKDANITDDYTVKYALVDLDQDDKDEMIVLFESYDGFYLILNIEDDKVYGFEKDYRSMVSIKEDGTMLATNSADSSEIYKISFDKNKIENISLAIEDGNTYKLDNKTATEAEVKNYFEEFNNKKEVEFIDYK